MDGLLGYTSPEDGAAAAARPLPVLALLLGDALGLLEPPLPFTAFFLDMAPIACSPPGGEERGGRGGGGQVDEMALLTVFDTFPR